MEHLNIKIEGKYTKYAEIIAEQGYCFYDVDDEKRQYFKKIFTPITDETIIVKKYIVVDGDAEKLNEELMEQELKEVEDGTE